jgi:hypothetical protein
MDGWRLLDGLLEERLGHLGHQSVSPESLKSSEPAREFVTMGPMGIFLTPGNKEVKDDKRKGPSSYGYCYRLWPLVIRLVRLITSAEKEGWNVGGRMALIWSERM